MLSKSFSLFVMSIVGAGSLFAQIPADLEANSILGTASVSAPLSVRHAGDGSGRLFIAQRDGEILIHKPGSGGPTDILGAPFLTVAGISFLGSEGGLLGLAFHPSYESNGYFYVSYTRGGPSTTVIERFEVSAGDPDVADSSSGEEIFTLAQPAGNHNGGDLHFGPDGYLYLSLGDGGGGGGPPNGQDINTLLGSIIRIDPCDSAVCDGSGPNDPPYSVPMSNPFVGVAGADEIWSYGLRNPYRFSFDSLTGDMYVGDVGSFGSQSTEEVNFDPATSVGGRNFGWSCEEGVDFGDCGMMVTTHDPIMSYSSDAGPDSAISGGYTYRGCIEGLRGMHIFGDSGSSRVRFGTQVTPGNWTVEQPAEWDLTGGIVGFGEGEDGELYLLTFSDVFRFESISECVTGGIFDDGFESGDTTQWSSTTP